MRRPRATMARLEVGRGEGRQTESAAPSPIAAEKWSAHGGLRLGTRESARRFCHSRGARHLAPAAPTRARRSSSVRRRAVRFSEPLSGEQRRQPVDCNVRIDCFHNRSRWSRRTLSSGASAKRATMGGRRDGPTLLVRRRKHRVPRILDLRTQRSAGVDSFSRMAPESLRADIVRVMCRHQRCAAVLG
jgi:hypothetical protein